MKVIEIRNLLKKDIPLHYRNEYTGDIILETNQAVKMQKKLEFSLERRATGDLDIQIQFKEDIGYPLIPVIKTVKDYIIKMEKEGDLR
ncbi:MAG: hypothetical protein JW874_13690 [Spirochaetales bacterium]|nr:hypothetical protein [Spirochaetales bacterium]